MLAHRDKCVKQVPLQMQGVAMGRSAALGLCSGFLLTSERFERAASFSRDVEVQDTQIITKGHISSAFAERGQIPATWVLTVIFGCWDSIEQNRGDL